MKGIATMFQYIFMSLLWSLLFGSIVKTGEAKHYSLKENQLESKDENIQRHLLRVSPQTNSVNAGKNTFSSLIDLESNSRMTSPFKGNSSPIDLERHNAIKLRRSANWFDVSKPIQNFDEDIDSDKKVLNNDDHDDHGDNNDNDDHDDINDHNDVDTSDSIIDYLSKSNADGYITAALRMKRALRRKVKNGNGRILPEVQTDKCECGTYNKKAVQNRIINGVETAKNQYPWMVSIKYTGNNHFCGGSIISDQFILTAAHCTFGMKPNELQVTIGDHDLTKDDISRAQTLSVKTIFNYPEYDEFTTNNDLALLKLKQPITFTWRMNPICLTPQDLTYYKETVTVMGWGLEDEDAKKSSPVLKHVQVRVLPMNKCRNDFRYKSKEITSKMLCAYEKGQDACQGDSGGPLVWLDHREDRYFQIGATSWGIGCASEFHPGVYTKLTKFVAWVYSTAKDSTFCQTYIPKGAKRKDKGTKARLDKDETEKKKGGKEEENIENEVDENEDIHLAEGETSTENNNVTFENDINVVNSVQNRLIGQLENSTDSFVNTTEKGNGDGNNKDNLLAKDEKNGFENNNQLQNTEKEIINDYETYKYGEVKDNSIDDHDSNNGELMKNRGMEKIKHKGDPKIKNKVLKKAKPKETYKKKGNNKIYPKKSRNNNRKVVRKSGKTGKSLIKKTNIRKKVNNNYQTD